MRREWRLMQEKQADMSDLRSREKVRESFFNISPSAWDVCYLLLFRLDIMFPLSFGLSIHQLKLASNMLLGCGCPTWLLYIYSLLLLLFDITAVLRTSLAPGNIGLATLAECGGGTGSRIERSDALAIANITIIYLHHISRFKWHLGISW